MARFTTITPSVFFAIAVATLLVLAAAADADRVGRKHYSCSQRRSDKHFLKLVRPCIRFIELRNKGEPKAEDIPKKCCETFKKVDAPCICKNLPDFATEYFHIEKFVFAAQICSLKKLQPGTKCSGVYTVPPFGFGVEERKS